MSQLIVCGTGGTRGVVEAVVGVATYLQDVSDDCLILGCR